MYPSSQFRQELARERYAELLAEARVEQLVSVRRDLEPTPLERLNGLGVRLRAVLRPGGRARAGAPAPRCAG